MRPMGERTGTWFTRGAKPGRYLHRRGGYYKASMTEKKRILRGIKRAGKQDLKREVQQQVRECDE